MTAVIPAIIFCLVNIDKAKIAATTQYLNLPWYLRNVYNPIAESIMASASTLINDPHVIVIGELKYNAHRLSWMMRSPASWESL